jgi:hypothetical protein
MSTETRRGKKRRGLTVERVRIIEYVCIGLVVLLFTGLAILYGTRSNGEAGPSPSPAPTEDDSIRGRNVLEALERGGYTVVTASGGYDVTAPDGTVYRMEMNHDGDGIVLLSFETELTADPDDDTETSVLLREKNRKTLDSLRDLLDRIMPVFHRPAADSDTVVRQCAKVVSDGEPYSKHLAGYTVRVECGQTAVSQTVTVSLIRDP